MSITVQGLTSGSPHRSTSNLLLFRVAGVPAANGQPTRPAVTAVASDPVVNWARNSGAQIQLSPRAWFNSALDTPDVFYHARCGTVRNISIIDGGENWTGVPVATVDNTGTGGSGCTLGTVTMATGVTSFTIGSGASNYPLPPAVTITDLAGTGSGGIGHLVVGPGGNVLGFVIDQAGSNYGNPSAVPTGGGGSGCILSVGQSGGQLANPAVVAPGSGYNTGPAVTVPPPAAPAGPQGGKTPSVLAVVYDSNAGSLAGQIRAIVPMGGGVPGCGSGYTGTSVSCTVAAPTSGPTPTITGHVSQYVANIQVSAAGDNYNKPPRVVLTGGSPTRPAAADCLMTGFVASDSITWTAPASWLSCKVGGVTTNAPAAAAAVVTNNAGQWEAGSAFAQPPTMPSGVNVGAQPVAAGSASFIHKNLFRSNGIFSVDSGTGVPIYGSDLATPSTWTVPTGTILRSTVYDPTSINQIDGTSAPAFIGPFTLCYDDTNVNTSTAQPLQLGTTRSSSISLTPVSLTGDTVPVTIPSNKFTISGSGGHITGIDLTGITFASTYQAAGILVSGTTGSGFMATVEVQAGSPAVVHIHCQGSAYSSANVTGLIYGQALSGTEIKTVMSYSYANSNPTTWSPGVVVRTSNSAGAWGGISNIWVVGPLPNGQANTTIDRTKTFASSDNFIQLLAPANGDIVMRAMDRTQGFGGTSNLRLPCDLVDATSGKPWRNLGNRTTVGRFKFARYLNTNPASGIYSWTTTRCYGPQSWFSNTSPGFIITGTTASGSPVVTALSDMSNLMVGAAVSGPGIPAGSYVGYLGALAVATPTNNSPVVKGFSSTSLFSAGMAVSGSGIPNGATILSVDSSSQVTLSVNATSSSPAGLIIGPEAMFTLGSPSGLALATATASGVGLSVATLNFQPLPAAIDGFWVHNNDGSNKVMVCELESDRPHGMVTGDLITVQGDILLPITGVVNTSVGFNSATQMNGTLSNGSSVVTGLSFNAGLMGPGMPVVGTGIQVGTVIQSVNSSSQITLSKPATSGGAQSLLVTGFAPITADSATAFVTSPTTVAVAFFVNGSAPSPVPNGPQTLASTTKISLTTSAFPNGWYSTLKVPSNADGAAEPYECLAYTASELPGSTLRVNFPASYTDGLITLIGTRIAAVIGSSNTLDGEYSNEDWNGGFPARAFLSGVTTLLTYTSSGTVLDYATAPIGNPVGYFAAHVLLGGHAQNLLRAALNAAGATATATRRLSSSQWSNPGITTGVLNAAAAYRVPVDRVPVGAYLTMPSDWPISVAISPPGSPVTGAGYWPMDAYLDLYRWWMVDSQINQGYARSIYNSCHSYATATGFPAPLASTYEGGPSGFVGNIVPLQIALLDAGIFHQAAREVAYGWFAAMQQGDPTTTGSGYAEACWFQMLGPAQLPNTWAMSYGMSMPAGPGTSNQFPLIQAGGPADMHEHSNANDATMVTGWLDWFGTPPPVLHVFRGWFPRVKRHKVSARR
jgi:hypothetical protein